MLKTSVRDVMIPINDYSTVSHKATLREAVSTLRGSYCELDTETCTEAGHRTVFVLDDQGRLKGILDFSAILRTLIPEVAGGLTKRLSAAGVSAAFAEADASDLDEANMGFRARIRKNAEVKVDTIMLKIRGTIQADAGLMDALKMIFKNKITKLPVYEGDRLVGVLRDADLVLAVHRFLEEEG
jgi:CBS-domain-containing membrane protein